MTFIREEISIIPVLKDVSRTNTNFWGSNYTRASGAPGNHFGNIQDMKYVEVSRKLAAAVADSHQVELGVL